MLVIDSHTHLGGSLVTESVYTEAELLAAMEKWSVAISLVIPLPHGTPSPEAMHDRIYGLTQEKPDRFFGVADLNPMLSEEAYWKEAQRCFKDLGFVALKLNPRLHPCNPLSRFATKVFEVGKHFKVPVIVHTGLGSPFSLPSLMITRAREFPDVSIILAHAGATYYTSEAIVAAEICDNIWLEPSWCGSDRVKEAIRKLGSARVMMGSDVPINLPVELTKYRTLGLTDGQLEDCLARTAAHVFRLPIKV